MTLKDLRDINPKRGGDESGQAVMSKRRNN